MMTESERLKLLVDSLCGGSQARFVRKTGLCKTSINKIIKGKAKEIGLSLSEKHIAKIVSAFPCVSAEFLRTGVGYPGDITVELTVAKYRALLAARDKEIASLKQSLARSEEIISCLLKK